MSFVSVYPQGQASVWPRKGFSVLELLIALGLLGTLLALAWSILGSYRSAQQRGWDQSYRLQIAAAARELLEDDAVHFSSMLASPSMLASQPNSVASPPAIESNTNLSPQRSCDFQGSEKGFAITIVTSLDPLPWLEHVLVGDSAAEQVLDVSDLYGQTNPSEQNDQVLPIPQGNLVRLRYDLQPQAQPSTQPVNVSGATVETVWQLVRSVQPLNSTGQPEQVAESATADPDRLLTSADLYRLTEDEQTTEARGPATHYLRGLVAAQFRYYDGQQWRGRWNSDFQSGLPRAIEFSFDYPSARNPDAVEAIDAPSGLEADADSEPFLITPTEIDTIEASADVDDETPIRDVRIVVLLPAAPATTTVSGEMPFIGGAP